MTLPQAKPSHILKFQEILEAHRLIEGQGKDGVCSTPEALPVSSPNVCAAHLAVRYRK
jgi:hypothetical protein